MLEENDVREECLYCHGQIMPRKVCPFCGDVRDAESKKADPSMFPTPIFPPGPVFEPKVAGV